MRCWIALFPALLAGACSDMTLQPKQKAYRPLVGPAQTPSNTVGFGEKRPSARR